MADLNSTIVRGNLRVTDDISTNGTITGNGSGLTNLNASNIGSGSLALARITTGTNGQVLKMVSGVASWSSDVGFANPMTTAGDIIVGGTSGAASRLAKGSNGTFLGVNSSGNVAWVSNPNTDTKVTAVGNHYTPSGGSDLTASSSGTATRGTTNVLTNVAIDAAGHITGGTWYTLPASDNTHNSHIVYSGKKSDGTTDISSGTASSGNITLGDSGVTAGSYGNSSNQTPSYGATFNVPYITVNAKGIVTAVSDKTVKIPASDNTNTTLSGIAYCSTAAGTAAKVATMPGFALSNGQRILLRTTVTNSATSSVTLSVNSTAAKTIKIGSDAVTASNFPAGDYIANYDGTNWVLTRIYLTDNNTWRAIQVDSTQKIASSSSTALNFVSANTNDGDISFTYDGGIKATAKVSGLAVDSNVVHKGASSAVSNEDIYGTKTFKDGGVSFSDTLGSDTYNSWILTGTGKLTFRTRKGSSNLIHGNVAVNIPTLDDSTAQNVDISFPTTSGTVALDENVVHKGTASSSSTEDIYGTKFFRNSSGDAILDIGSANGIDFSSAWADTTASAVIPKLVPISGKQSWIGTSGNRFAASYVAARYGTSVSLTGTGPNISVGNTSSVPHSILYDGHLKLSSGSGSDSPAYIDFTGVSGNSGTIKLKASNLSSGTKTVVIPAKDGTLITDTDLAGYIPLSGSSNITGSLLPSAANQGSLGNGSRYWNTVDTNILIVGRSMSGTTTDTSSTIVFADTSDNLVSLRKHAGASGTVWLPAGTTTRTLISDADLVGYYKHNFRVYSSGAYNFTFTAITSSSNAITTASGLASLLVSKAATSNTACISANGFWGTGAYARQIIGVYANSSGTIYTVYNNLNSSSGAYLYNYQYLSDGYASISSPTVYDLVEYGV